MTRAALYARVSTTDQHAENQLAMLRAYALARGWEAIEYVDHISGAKERRKALDVLVAAARGRKIDVVVCVKLDRLARSLRHLVTLVAEWEALGIQFVVTDQAIDTTTPVGRFTFHVLAAVAEFERELIRERVVAGMRRAKAAGKHCGRPRLHMIDGRKAVALTERNGVSAAARALGVHHQVVTRAIARTKGAVEQARKRSAAQARTRSGPGS